MTGVVLSPGRSGQAKTDGCCAANQDRSHCESFRHGREVSIASSTWLGAVGENETQLHNAGAAQSTHSCFAASAEKLAILSPSRTGGAATRLEKSRVGKEWIR